MTFNLNHHIWNQFRSISEEISKSRLEEVNEKLNEHLAPELVDSCQMQTQMALEERPNKNLLRMPSIVHISRPDGALFSFKPMIPTYYVDFSETQWFYDQGCWCCRQKARPDFANFLKIKKTSKKYVKYFSFKISSKTGHFYAKSVHDFKIDFWRHTMGTFSIPVARKHCLRRNSKVKFP